MQSSLQIPLELELNNFSNLPTQLKLTPKIQIQDSDNLNTQNISKLVQPYLPVITDRYYPEQFIKIYLLVKINSLSKKQCNINFAFLQQLTTLYNRSCNLNIYICYNQAEIFSQIISRIQQPVTLKSQQFLNIIQGNGLLAATGIYFLQKSSQFLKKQQVAFTLSFISLGGRQIAFTPIVHKQKNHAGQIHYAKQISQLFLLQKKLQKQQSKVQDPYSMRCSPQVHGIAYDCYWQLQKNIKYLINKPHHKYLNINGKNISNLLLQSDTYSLKIDYLICCLQQIGAMSYLRSQRILNKYLGKNKLMQKGQYNSLLAMLQTAMYYTSKNKLLCTMTNFDTINIDSYNKDIFYASGSYYNKIIQLFNNLYFIMTIQILASLQVMKQATNNDLSKINFVSKTMQDNFMFLKNQVNVMERNKSLENVKEIWNIL